jgi:chorismate synthase
MGSIFGQIFRLSTFGESHGGAVGVVVDGCPPRLPLTVEEIQRDLDRRRPGQSKVTTPRDEPDRPEILSGVFEGQTLGTPIAVMVRNTDARPQSYEGFKDTYRPSHADYTYEAKYGIRNWQGGGRASARETIGRVAAGAIARKLLASMANVEVLAYVTQIYNIEAAIDSAAVTLAEVESNIVRCPDSTVAQAMIARIEQARREGDSLGGIVECVCRRVPPGLGEPVFDKLEADLARALMSLPASKGFEIGSGFGGIQLTGIEHNDPFTTDADGRIRTRSNRSGGVQGGISNGEDIIIRPHGRGDGVPGARRSFPAPAGAVRSLSGSCAARGRQRRLLDQHPCAGRLHRRPGAADQSAAAAGRHSPTVIRPRCDALPARRSASRLPAGSDRFRCDADSSAAARSRSGGRSVGATRLSPRRHCGCLGFDAARRRQGHRSLVAAGASILAAVLRSASRAMEHGGARRRRP